MYVKKSISERYVLTHLWKITLCMPLLIINYVFSDTLWFPMTFVCTFHIIYISTSYHYSCYLHRGWSFRHPCTSWEGCHLLLYPRWTHDVVRTTWDQVVQGWPGHQHGPTADRQNKQHKRWRLHRRQEVSEGSIEQQSAHLWHHHRRFWTLHMCGNPVWRDWHCQRATHRRR